MNFINNISNSLLHNPELSNLLRSYGIDIQSVAWEDSARDKGSCVGPNISDMTLYVDNIRMPIIRKPNFSDVTYDLPIDFFKVCVGNENDKERKIISLKKLIQDIKVYSNNYTINDLLCDRDEQILSSAQCCLLPCKENSNVNFCIDLYNYQSINDDPAVLVITSSKDGTSIQVLESHNEKLYFNDNGNAYDFKAERLADIRKKRTGRGQESVKKYSDMSGQEKLENTIMVFQIPLKRKKTMLSRSVGESCCMDDSAPLEMSMPMKSKGIDMGVLSKGDYKGSYGGTKNLKLERDPRFPIRCTFQWYRVTDTTTIEETVVKDIASQFKMFEDNASEYGSLVTTTTDRKTEPSLKSKLSTDDPQQKCWGNEGMLPFLSKD